MQAPALASWQQCAAFPNCHVWELSCWRLHNISCLLVCAVTRRDDGSRLALHWAAELGLVEVTQLLLQETVAAAQQLRQQMEAAGDTADSYAPMNLVQIQVGPKPACRA
jgi:hypothetical protein